MTANSDHVINNDEDTISTDPQLLTPTINYYFSCDEFDVDETSYSDATISHDDISDEVHVPSLPLKSPTACVPEITCISTSKNKNHAYLPCMAQAF